jgi:pimeloyl-ACP methyl ester carboxylesterase
MDRRDLLTAGGVLAAADVLGAGSPASAARRSDTRSFLFVHGAWHAATHWNEVTARLSAMGHRALAIDLPGSGLYAGYPRSYLRNDFRALVTEVSPLKDLHLDGYRRAVVAQVRQMARHRKVTLVGHSFGGATITLVAEAVPHLIDRLVYLAAVVPIRLPSAAAYSALPENRASLSGAIQIGDPAVTGAVRINPRSADPRYIEMGRRAFYGDVRTAEYIRFAAYLNPDLSFAAYLDDARGTPRRWGRVPRTFIRCTQDRVISIALQDRMIREADAATPGNRFDVRSLPSSHSAFASMPGRLAELLASLAGSEHVAEPSWSGSIDR